MRRRRGRGRPSLSGGVTPAGPEHIRFDLTIAGKRMRPTKPWIPTEGNLERARQYRAYLLRQEAEGRLQLDKEFPEYCARFHERIPIEAQTCATVFDAFLRHAEARVLRDELSQATVDAHRQILNRDWRPHVGHILFKTITASLLDRIADQQKWSKKTYNNTIGSIKSAFRYASRDYPERQDPSAALQYAKIKRQRVDPLSAHDAERLITAIHNDWGPAQGNYDEFRIFTGLRPCEEIALRVSDYDQASGVLNVTKSRRNDRERDRTKNGRERRVKLCPRAIAVLERHLKLRADMVERGLIDHDYLFVADYGSRMRRMSTASSRWTRTLAKLPIRYRRPYVARHTSGSWNLIIGHPAAFVADQHGHSLITMHTTYAGWVQDAQPHEAEAIRRAMGLD